MSTSSDDESDDTQIRFQEAHGARLFREGKPRAVLEVKSPNIATTIYEARLRGYDRAKTAKERLGVTRRDKRNSQAARASKDKSPSTTR